MNYHRTTTPKTLLYAEAAGLDPARFPRHIAIIMDGNGRWATARGQERYEGHLRGTETVRTIVTEACRLGLEQLTLYCLSIENWKRPKHELDFLMALLKQYLIDERELILREKIRFRVIGRRDGLPDEVLAEIDTSEAMSREHPGLTLCLAINYGGRTELVDAMRQIASQVQRGELAPEQIQEETIAAALYTATMPDPDLLIRTAGEMRVSNYLLWQISYAELWVTPTLWPEFDRFTLHDALKNFAKRERRFGGLNQPTADAQPASTTAKPS